MNALRFALRYVRRHWLQYVLGIVWLLAVDMLQVYIPQFTGMITDGLSQQSMDMTGVWHLLWLVLAAAGGVTLGRFFWRFFLFGASRQIEKEMRNDLFGHLETLSMRFLNQNKTGDLMSRFTNDMNAVRMLLGMTVITTVDATVELILVLYKMTTYVSPRLTLVAVAPMIVISFGDIFYGKAMHKRFKAKQEAFSDLTDQVQESVSGIRVIKAFVQEKKELHAFAMANLRCKEKNLGVARLQALVIPLLEMVIGSSMLLTLLYGGYLAIQSEITLGQFVAFNSYITMLVWPMIAVGEAITNISQGMASLGRIVEIFDARPEITDSDATDFSVTRLHGEITLDGLRFAYPDTPNVPVLDDISLTVPAGGSLAVIGRTGSGKTTLANLLLRLYDCGDGMIRLDGHPLRQLPLETLRREIAYVPQDNFLFSDTIENNIAFGVESIDRERLEQAAKDACIHDNIMDFPDGYRTVVGERGATISGGQKQRTSIARALLKDAPILILDDALSAVDTDTEEQILQNLQRIRSGKTTLIIAHRISTIQSCDRILVLEDGRMAEYGTHEELLRLGGIYRDIYDKQQLERELNEEGSDA